MLAENGDIAFWASDKRIMKRLIVLLFFVAQSAWGQNPQPDLSWTFQRWGNTCGLLFEDTTLTTSVKAAIRDDIANAYNNYATTNDHYTTLYAPGNPDYGIFDGFDGLQGDNGLPNDLGGWDYKLHNGNRYFTISTNLSTKYQQKIALTNQFKTAAGSLSNFLATVNSVIPSNVVKKTYFTYWWDLRKNRTIIAKDFPEPENFMEFLEPYCEEEMLFVSLLSFVAGEDELKGKLCCEVVFKNRNEGHYQFVSSYIYAYIKGKWRVVLPDF